MIRITDYSLKINPFHVASCIALEPRLKYGYTYLPKDKDVIVPKLYGHDHVHLEKGYYQIPSFTDTMTRVTEKHWIKVSAEEAMEKAELRIRLVGIDDPYSFKFETYQEAQKWEEILSNAVTEVLEGFRKLGKS